LEHNNADDKGYSSVVLQAPFLPHYYEADPGNSYANAAWIYEVQHPESHTTFELINGMKSLGLVRFTLTDENNRRFLTAPTADIHMVLTLKTESTARKRKHQEHTTQLLREMLATQRLALLQNEILDKQQVTNVLKIMQEQTGGAEDLLNTQEEDAGSHRARKGRKFLPSVQKGEEQIRYADPLDNVPGPRTAYVPTDAGQEQRQQQPDETPEDEEGKEESRQDV
jgi:hypothetical protein